MKRKKVLIAINCMNIGGAPSVVFNHLKYLDRERFDPYLLMLYKSKPANFLSRIDFLPDDHIVQFSSWRRSPLDIVTWFKVFLFLRKEGFDAVMTHLFLANFVVRSAAICARTQKIFAFEHSQYSEKRPWQIFADRILARWTTAIVVAHEAIARFTAGQESIALEKFTIIPNPVSVRKPSPQEQQCIKERWGIDDSFFSFFVLWRFSEEKGQRYVLKAAQQLAQRTREFRVYIVGHGPLESTLRQEVERRGITDMCRIIRDPDHAQAGFFLTDVCIVPSVREGFSLVTAEALMSGMPVIASSLPTLQYIEEEHYGILFPVGNDHALAEIMYRCITNPGTIKYYQKHITSSRLLYEPQNIAAQVAELL